MPALARSATVLFASDVHPACPNSVIEALACGLPVVGFETGALREVVGEEAGRVVPFGGDSWRLESPDLAALAQAAGGILESPKSFRTAARARAEALFNLDRMIDSYLRVLGWAT